MPNKPLRVGITGGIGSGKSVICKIFILLGVPVYDADDRARLLMVRDKTIIHAIQTNFGERAYSVDGELNRAHLAKNVFNNKKKLSILNAIVHPVVATDFQMWCELHKNNVYVIKEAALLVESGSYKSLDFLITVTAPEYVRITRILARDQHRSEEQIRQIISNQLSDSEKISKSKFIIINDNHALVIPQVLGIHDFFNNYVQAG